MRAKRRTVSGLPRVESLENRLLLDGEWTILFYVDGDNNLEDQAIADVNEMEMIGSTINNALPASNINLVVQLDRAPGYDISNGDWTDTRRGLVVQDADPAVIATQFTTINEMNMGNQSTLTSFITWATNATRYDADHYALILWDHGGGIAGAAYDETSGNDQLTLKEMRQAIVNAGIHFDLIAFDACLMGMAEMASEVSDLCDVFVGSEDLIPGTGFDYNGFLGSVAGADAPTLAQAMVDSYQTEYTVTQPNLNTTLSAIDMAEYADFESALDDLSRAWLTENVEWDLVRLATAQASRNMGNFAGQDFYDIGTFLDYVVANAVNVPIHDAAQTARTQYDQSVIANYSGQGVGTGLSIYIPDSIYSTFYDDYAARNYRLLQLTEWDRFVQAYCEPMGEIDLLVDGAAVADGDTVDFGTILAGTAGPTRTFTVTNSGLGDLRLTRLAVPADFTGTDLTDSLLSPGQSTTFTVELTASAAGVYSEELRLYCGDYGENPFNLTLTGQIVNSGEIAVDQNGTPLTDGQLWTVDFGAIIQGDAAPPMLFTILNEHATESLGIGTIELPVGLVLATPPASTVLAPGESTMFELALDTASLGNVTGSVIIFNSDPDETEFDFPVTGFLDGPDLVVSDFDYEAGVFAVGSDTVVSRITLQNAGAAGIPGRREVTVEVVLSLDQVWDNGDDVSIYDGTVYSYNLGAGETGLPRQLDMGAAYANIEEGLYYVGVRVNGDGAIDDADLTNNTRWSAAADVELYEGRNYTRLRTGGKAVFVDNNGRSVTVSIKGPGRADVKTDNSLLGRRMSGDIERIILAETTAATSVTISVSGGTSTVRRITATGDVKSIVGKGLILLEGLEIGGSLGSLSLAGLDSAVITIGVGIGAGAAANVTLNLGAVSDSSIVSAIPIRSLTVSQWDDAAGPDDLITAPWIGSLTTKADKKLGLVGDFAADLTLSGVGAVKGTLGAVKVAGGVSQVNWDITGDMGAMTVAGRVEIATIRTTGSMGAISVGAAEAADFLAGIDPAVVRHAGALADFVNPAAAIASFKVTGKKLAGPLFADSNLSAASIGLVNLLNVDLDNGHTGFGFYARTGGGIAGVSALDTATGNKWAWRPGAPFVMPDLEIQVLAV